MGRAVSRHRGVGGAEAAGAVARRAPGLFLLLIALPLPAVACGGGHEDPDDVLAPGTAVEVRVGESFTLAVGETATLPGAGISVRLVAISTDSRCPIDVNCVWAGDVAVALRATVVGGAPETLELHHPTEVMGPRRVAVGGHWIELVRVEPAPVSDGPIPEADYRATFRLDERAG